jgi:hypothetical protein
VRRTGSALSIDRIQVVVPDRAAATERWRRLLDAALVREDRVLRLGCDRTVLALGSSEVELLEAHGPGPVRDAGPGLFAAGFASADMAGLRARLERRRVPFEVEADQLFLAPPALGGQGLRVVVTPEAKRARAGLLSRLYEVTNLVAHPGPGSARLAEVFDLDRSAFVPIRSEQFGYEGTLTLFEPGALDRVEIIHPYDASKTMGRYHARHGACLYMAYAETDHIEEIRERARSLAPDAWTGPDGPGSVDNLFLHPKALGGVMLGVSRTTFAWSWSGSPGRVAPAA